MANRKLRNVAKIMTVAMGACAIVAPLTACNGKGLSNETSHLVLASDILDGVFNPFFYTAGADGEIVGQTQIGMLTSDSNGKPLAAWDEPSVAHDYGIVTTGTPKDIIESAKGDDKYENYYTDYYFALKDNIKFSDGTLLTKDDVLYNIYMYLDPSYTGSSTMYSVDIKGLTYYRTQTRDPNEAENTDEYYDSIVDSRIGMIYKWAEDAKDEKNNFNFTWGNWFGYEYYINTLGLPDTPENRVIQKDIETIQALFKDEIDSDWTMSMAVDVEKDYEKYVDRNGNRLFTENWQVFLYSYGIITLTRTPALEGVNEEYYEMHDNSGLTDKSEAAMKDFIYQYYFGEYGNSSVKDFSSYAEQLLRVIDYSGSSQAIRNYIRSDVISRDLKRGEDGSLDVPTVSGIEILQRSEIEHFDDATNTKIVKTLKDQNGNPKTFDVLHIRINGVDPKAIQNFSFTVAPGHYYSSTWDKVKTGYGDSVENPYFGVEFNNYDFMRAIRANQLPLGAGPYKASKSNGGVAASKDDFFDSNVVYFERNEHFMLGAPKIKSLRYQVVNNNMLYDAVKTGQVHYASPNMDIKTIDKLQGADRDILNYDSADNLGYGYIGISARYVPNLWVRRAIMSTFDPQLCVDYYGGSDYASIIRRPMSKTLVDYYDEVEFNKFDDYSYYPYGQEGGTAADLEKLTAAEKRQNVKDIALKYARDMGKCTVRNGKLIDPCTNQELKYTFTVAGNSEDHPAFALLNNSMEILNEIGFDISLSQDSTALSKLSAGRLTVWAAAWSSSSDPDMFQVYHKDSNATSTLAWGYNYIRSAQHASSSEFATTEIRILDDLSDLIDDGREVTSVNERKPIYIEAQNKLMQLAVEFPTYQRKVYYVWQRGLFDESTMFTGADVGTYQSPLSRIWEVSFNEG